MKWRIVKFYEIHLCHDKKAGGRWRRHHEGRRHAILYSVRVLREFFPKRSNATLQTIFLILVDAGYENLSKT